MRLAVCVQRIRSVDKTHKVEVKIKFKVSVMVKDKVSGSRWRSRLRSSLS